METYYGHVRTPADAIILFEACRLGLLPRVQRRLSEKERQSIRSGSVFVWDEREAGMRRWTDGKSWSASRVSGSFLTYREMEGKRGGNGFAPVTAAQRVSKTPEGPRGSDSDLDMGEDGPDGYRYKPDGLMKQSFSITTSNGQHLHLISYYARSHPAAQGLQQPSSDQSLRNIRPQKGMYPESTVHEQSNVPVVTRGPMLGAPFAGSPLGMSLAPPGYHHARSGPPPPQMYLPHGYAWAPTPVMGHHQYAIHPHMAGQMGPPPMAGLSPLQYAVPLPPTSQGPPPGAYDRRPLSAGSLPPPNTGGYRGETSMPPSQSPVPSRDGPQPPGSGGMIDPRLQPTSGQSNQSPSGQHQSAPQQASPRENGTTGTPPIGVLPNTPEKIEGTPVKDPPTSASTIPSIGALVNGAMKDGIDVKREMDGGRAGSRSPGEAQKRENAPPMSNSEKLPFGEDTRVLRVLDKVFPA